MLLVLREKCMSWMMLGDKVRQTADQCFCPVIPEFLLK